MKTLSKLFAFVMIAMLSVNAMAADKPTNKKKQIPQDQYLTAVEAHSLLKKDASKVLFVDVRTPYEVQYVGSTSMMDKNIPIVTISLKKWDKKKKRYARILNKKFVSQVKKALKAKGLTKADKIIFMCRSGKRSIYTSKLMAKAGYHNVATIVDGFEGGKDKKFKHRITKSGWKNTCPAKSWGYKNHKAKMYFQ